MLQSKFWQAFFALSPLVSLLLLFVGYGVFRFLVEFFRQPDAHLGFLWGGATMGQLLSLPMVLFGLGGWVYLYRRAGRS